VIVSTFGTTAETARRPFSGRRTRLGDVLLQAVAGGAALGTVVLLGLLVYKVVEGARLSLSTFGLGFITSIGWDPVHDHMGAAVFLFGGIDFEQFVLAHVLTIMTALSIGAVSLFWSALFRRSLPATVTSYATTFFLVVGTFVAGLLLTYIYAFRDGVAAASNFEFHPLAYGNPLFAMYVVLASPSGAPVHLGRLLQLLFMSGGDPSRWGPELEPWKLCVAFEMILTALAIFGAVLLVRGRRAMPLRRVRPAMPEPAA